MLVLKFSVVVLTGSAQTTGYILNSSQSAAMFILCSHVNLPLYNYLRLGHVSCGLCTAGYLHYFNVIVIIFQRKLLINV